MNPTHWQKFQRLYVAALIFVYCNATAAVAIFSGVNLDTMTRRQFAFGIVKVLAMATGALLVYVGITPKTVTQPVS